LSVLARAEWDLAKIHNKLVKNNAVANEVGLFGAAELKIVA
jgi:hypothetical protein